MPENTAARLQTLFAEALELNGADRDAFLARECADDPALLVQLRGLLGVDAKLANSTARPIALGLSQLLAATGPGSSLSGTRVGPYELREELGRGGMGTVYRAERVDGTVEQQVAIKFIRRELLDANTLKRFQLERQLLAGLDHPNIARLLDASELEDGTPYYVMEYVAGVPITEHCAQAKLGVRERVSLLRAVCGAVAQAHRNLVVHRDLKPGNILVSADGIPKLLDFGIAKPLGPAHLGDETGTAQRYFSPQYAAPEQISGVGVGVACDVYALGLLLYELIADVRPFDFTDLTAGQVETLINSVPPPAPSAAALRDGASKSLVRELRGDLDDIVLRCLRKAPSERYASVEQLEADLANYLEGRPVAASGGHTVYRLRKFVGRHRLPVAIATAAALALAGAAAAIFIQNLALARERDRVALERDRAQQAVSFLKNAFEAADPSRASGADVTARQILAAAQRDLDSSLSGQPQLFAELAATIADVELGLGLASEAAELSGRAESKIRGTVHDPAVLASLVLLKTRSLIVAGDFRGAQTALDEAATIVPTLSAELRAVRGWLHSQQGQYEEGIKDLRAAVIGLESAPPKDAIATMARMQLADALRLHGEFDKSLATLDQTLAWQTPVLGSTHPRVILTRLRRADLLRRLGRGEEALVDARNARSEIERVYGPHAPTTAGAYNTVGNALVGLKREQEAIPEYRHALSVWQDSVGQDHPQTLRTEFNLAQLLGNDPKESVQADALFQTCIAGGARRWGATHGTVLLFRVGYSRFLVEHDRAGAGLALLLEPDAVTASSNAQVNATGTYRAALGEAMKANGCRDPSSAAEGESGGNSTPSIDSADCGRAAEVLRQAVTAAKP